MQNAEINTTGARNPRLIAAQIVARWLVSGEHPNRMLSAIDKDRALVTELVYGVVRWRRLLEWILKQTVRRVPPPRLKAFVLTALYEIFIMQNAAEYAVVNETVGSVKLESASRQANFVNAVLRQALRDREKINIAIDKQRAGVRLSHPDVLVNRWINNYGETKALRLCDWNNSRPQVTIRINALKPPQAVEKLAFNLTENFAITSIAGRKHYYTVPHGARIDNLPGYAEGLFLVTDPFAVNAVELLAPVAGDTVLDACAAPGGKTFLIAEKMRTKGILIAVDRDEQRLLRLKTNLQRLGILDFVQVKKGDILELGRDTEKYDRILADVPCSNTGVIRRKPDIRWRFNLKGLGLLVKTQKKMLDRLAPLLKTGGTLVYSTCSLEPEENQMLIASWLEKNPSFCLIEERRFFPPESGADGGYAAAIIRREP